VRAIVQDESFWEATSRLEKAGEHLMSEKAGLDLGIRQKLGLRNPHDLSSGKALKEYGCRCCSNPECAVQESELIKNKKKLLICSRCVKHKAKEPARYCSKECQTKHWKVHLPICGSKTSTPPEFDGTWVDAWRASRDGSLHFGTLELITWDGVDEGGSLLGFGGVFREEADDLRKTFEEKFKKNLAKFCKKRSGAFRWTCCGCDVAMGMSGCDHHGDPRAHTPCACDYCLAGQPLSDKIWGVKIRSQPAKGLSGLQRGPDPKSVCEAGMQNWEMRKRFMAMAGGEL